MLTPDAGEDGTGSRTYNFRSAQIKPTQYISSLTSCSGWDPAFEYEGRTYAEMEKDEKNKISHRGKALEKLKAWLKENAD